MTDDPQWYWEHWQDTRPPDPTDPADQAKPSWLDSAAYSAYKNAPRFFQKLQIDELWLGYGHPKAAAPGATTTYEAEAGTVSGFAKVSPCAVCSGGAKVTNIGNDVGNDVTLTVNAPSRGDYLLTLVGSVAGTRSFYVSVNNGPLVLVTMTGSSFLQPRLAPFDTHSATRSRKHGTDLQQRGVRA
jgi:hypothetical protein